MNTARLRNFLRFPPGKTRAYAHQWFFTAACLHAVLMIPLMVLARHGYGPVVLALPTGHAFEMLLGFIPALIAGYLLGPMPIRRLVWLMGFWLLARITGLIYSVRLANADG